MKNKSLKKRKTQIKNGHKIKKSKKKKSEKISKIPFFSLKKKFGRKKNAILLVIRYQEDTIDQRSPVRPVSDFGGCTLSVTNGQRTKSVQKSLCLILDYGSKKRKFGGQLWSANFVFAFIGVRPHLKESDLHAVQTRDANN